MSYFTLCSRLPSSSILSFAFLMYRFLSKSEPFFFFGASLGGFFSLSNAPEYYRMGFLKNEPDSGRYFFRVDEIIFAFDFFSLGWNWEWKWKRWVILRKVFMHFFVLCVVFFFFDKRELWKLRVLHFYQSFGLFMARGSIGFVKRLNKVFILDSLV